MFLLALENFEALQTPFHTAFARYLGDISFSLYICHWIDLVTFTRFVTPEIINATGLYDMGFCIGGLLTLPVLIMVSDLQWRAVDENSVVFARWLAAKCSG